MRFRTLFEQAPFSVQLLASNGQTTGVNKAWEALWLVPGDDSLKEHVLSTNYNVLLDPQLEEKGVASFLRRAFRGESVCIPPILYDPRELAERSRPRWVEAHAHPIMDGEGNVREVMLIHNDITQHMEAEIERKKNEKALKESERRLKQLANSIPQLVWMADADGLVHWYNDRWYAYTGRTLNDMEGSGWQNLLDPSVLPSVVENWKQSIATAAPFQMTFPLLGADGTFRPFFSLVSPLHDESGRIVQWFGTNTDVSTLQETEHALRNALDGLEEASRRKDEFLAMLAHELRNPLAPISTAAQLLRISFHDERRLCQATDVITRQVSHMTELIDDLMDVSRVTRGLVQLSREHLDLKSVVTCALEQVRPLIESRRHALTTWMSHQHLSVEGDRTRLIQVVANLLSNAAKYTHPGGEIALRLEVEHAQAKISVSDNGTGIDAAFLPHVFELFTQAERTPDRSQGGLGIGLALVKSIMELHGGRAEVQSDGLGRGSTFTLALPIIPASAAMASLHCVEPEYLPGRSARIMIVDDNLDAATTMAALLEAQGHRVTVKADAKAALAEAAQYFPQAFILDIGLPDMTGYELATQLGAGLSPRRAIFIALTGYGQAHDRALSKAAGFDHHFVKPIDARQLTQVLSTASQLHHAE